MTKVYEVQPTGYYSIWDVKEIEVESIELNHHKEIKSVILVNGKEGSACVYTATIEEAVDHAIFMNNMEKEKYDTHNKNLLALTNG